MCEHWGVPDNKFDVYDANGEAIEISGNQNKIEKIIELGIIQEPKYKELVPPGPRFAQLYLGKKGTFVEKFERDAQERIKEVERQKQAEKEAKEAEE